MGIRNKIKVIFSLESGCSQENGEVSIAWEPINFSIYSSVFHELVSEATDQWISKNEIQHDTAYEVIFAHVMERDGGGAVVGEHFEEIYTEREAY